MKKINQDRNPVVDPAHPAAGAKPPHDREQLRRRLLQMILKTEADRRAAQLPAGRSLKPPRIEAATALNIFDPENLIGREFASGPLPPKRA